jgi:hypothetical protein
MNIMDRVYWFRYNLVRFLIGIIFFPIFFVWLLIRQVVVMFIILATTNGSSTLAWPWEWDWWSKE